MRTYKSSILFFNIDKNPEDATWYDLASEYEAQFKQNRSLPVFVGKETRDRIRSRVRLSVPFDAFDLGKSPQQILLVIKALINQWYTHGKRQYVRVRCEEGSKSRFNLRHDGDLYQGQIMDISSAGMACEFDRGNELRHLRKGSVLSKIQLKLNNRLVMLDGVIMGTRVDGTGQKPTLYVVMFRNHNDTGAAQKIKEYIRDRLQEEFESSLEFE